ncbi:MAG: FHA domain-containing protein [Planctomycetota bacterium]
MKGAVIIRIRVHEREIELEHKGRYIIGRADNCDIQVREAGVSRYHLFVDVEADGIYIGDMGSGNGTFVNNREITGRTALVKGDRVRAGTVEIAVSGYPAAVAAPAAPAPVAAAMPPAAAPAVVPPAASRPRTAAVKEARVAGLVLRAALVCGLLAAAAMVWVLVTAREPAAVRQARTDLARADELARAGDLEGAEAVYRGIPAAAEKEQALARQGLAAISARREREATVAWTRAVDRELAVIAEFQAAHADQPLEVLRRYDALAAGCRGTPQEAAVQRTADAFKATLQTTDKARFFAALDAVKADLQAERFGGALAGCRQVFEQPGLGEAEVVEMKRLVAATATAAADAAARVCARAEALVREGRFDEAAEAVRTAAAQFGLFPDPLLETLGIPAHSRDLTDYLETIAAAQRQTGDAAAQAVVRLRREALGLLADKRFVEAAVLLEARAGAVEVPAAREELAGLLALARAMTAMQDRLIAAVAARPLKVDVLKGSLVWVDREAVMVQDAAEGVEVRVAWKNIAFVHFDRILALAQAARTPAERTTLGEYFFAVGETALARVYLEPAAPVPGPKPPVAAAGTALAGLRAGRVWPGWSNYTAFMRFYGGPPKSGIAYEALRFYGITAGNVQYPGDAALEGGDPAVDFYVDDASRKGTLHLKQEEPAVAEAIAAFKRDRKNPAVLVRPHCYNDPAVRATLIANVKDAVTRYRDARPVAYALGDEISSESFVTPIDWCYCPSCLALFRAWLTTVYPDISAVNRVWGTRFTAFDQAMPATVQAMIEANNYFTGRSAERDMRYPELNYASHNDYREWRDINLAEVLAGLRDAGRSVDPDTPIGAVGLQRPAECGGFDYTRLPGVLDWVEAYDIGEVREVLRSFTVPGYPVVQTHFIDNNDPAGNKFRAWYYFAHGDRGVILWAMEHAFTSPPSPQAKPAMPMLKEAYETFRGGLAARRFAATMHTDGIAIYYSQPSIRFHWFVDAGVHGNTWPNRGADIAAQYSSDIRSRQAFVDMLENSGYQYDFVSSRAVAEHDLSAAEYPVLILPKTASLSDAEAAAITAYVRGGGLVIADYQTGMLDEHLRGRAAGALDDLFGIKRRGHRMVEWYDALAAHADWDYGFTPPARPDFRGMYAVEEGVVAMAGKPATSVGNVPVVISNRDGAGATYYLNLNMLNYPDVRFADPARGESMRMILANILEERGLRAPVEVYRGGRFAPNIEKIIWNGPDGDLLFVFINAAFRNTESSTSFQADLKAEPHPVTIKLTRGARQVTRFGDSADLGKVDQWEDLFTPAQPLVYILK